MHTHNRERGFTLIEVMIVVAIVAIIASIAFPSYQDSVRKSRRTDAATNLASFAQAMEKHFTENSDYLSAATGATAPAAPIATVYYSQSPVDGSSKYYNLTVQAATATTYTLRATPIGAQDGDGILELTSTGIKRWDKNDNDDITESGENCWRQNC